MAHKKGQGSSRNGRDSNAQFRGVKAYGGETVSSGTIIVRQLGTKFTAGRNVRIARDWSLFATSDGIVTFQSNGRVHVDPAAAAAAKPPEAKAPKAKAPMAKPAQKPAASQSNN